MTATVGGGANTEPMTSSAASPDPRTAMRVGVAGLGKMGTALAKRLLSQNVSVVAWNRTALAIERLLSEGALPANDLRSLWDGTAAVVTSLADDTALKAVCLGRRGLLAVAPPGALLIEMSTVSPGASASLAEEATARGVHYLRCPISGNPATVEGGKAMLIASGTSSTLARAREVLSLVAPKVTWVGENEEARVIKLAINAMLAATTEVLAELVVLSECYGIDRSVALEAVGGSVIGSPFVAYKRPALVSRDYRATFTTAMLLKDLDLVNDAASEMAIGLPVTKLVHRLIADACGAGLGDADFLALLPRLQAAAGRPSDLPVFRASRTEGR
jgi:3-hydroxyisobutyrate dehydrogenase-like beta-hydroxyacid dehydrogenase